MTILIGNESLSTVFPTFINSWKMSTNFQQKLIFSVRQKDFKQSWQDFGSPDTDNPTLWSPDPKKVWLQWSPANPDLKSEVLEKKSLSIWNLCFSPSSAKFLAKIWQKPKNLVIVSNFLKFNLGYVLIFDLNHFVENCHNFKLI